LGAAPLGDIELREDLDAGEHRSQEAAGRVVAPKLVVTGVGLRGEMLLKRIL
jgi:hypothetical protein